MVADQIVVALWGVRKELGNEFYDVITAVSRETESVSQLLRELQDLFLMYPPRVSFIVCFLDVLLPSLERTLKDMSTYLNEPLPIRSRWELLNEKLVEQSGMSIAARITMFVDLLAQLARFLSRSSLYDPTALEITCSRILRLRKLQGLSAFPLPPLNILQPPPVIERGQDKTDGAHWAQKIFDNKPQSVTAIKHHRDSLCFGPPMVGNQPQIPTESVILFKLSFDKNKISIMCYYDQAAPQVPIILCRWLDPYFNTLYSSHGAHELTVSRKGSSLQFRRWSLRANQSKIWAALFFKTYEKMVLFHCTFASLKCRSPLTIGVTPEDVCLGDERRLFQGKIVDDGFQHILTVLQDPKSGVVRLQAAVRTGELRRCPIWTAFVTQESQSSQWLQRRSRTRIWLKSLQVFVFCRKYNEKNQTKPHGQFEIRFMTEHAADAFQDMFQEGSEENGESIVVFDNQKANLIRDHVGFENKEEHTAATVEGESGHFDQPTTFDSTHDVSNSDESSIETWSPNFSLHSNSERPGLYSAREESLTQTQGREYNPNIARIREWQQSVSAVDSSTEIVHMLYTGCVTTFTAVFRAIKSSPQVSGSPPLTLLQEEFRKFYVWKDAISPSPEVLGNILESSRNLKSIVLTLMVQWSRALCRVPLIIDSCDWMLVDGELSALEAITAQADVMAGCLRRTHDQIVKDSSVNQDNDNASDSSSIRSLGNLGNVIEEMKVCTECLVELLPSLESPASDEPLHPKTAERERESYGSSVETLQPFTAFLLVLRDRFQLAEDRILRLLGQAMWQRRGRIRAIQRTREEIRNFETDNKPASNHPTELSGGSSSSESDLSAGQHSQMTRSSVTASSIFDREALVEDLETNRFGRLRHRESVSSFRSSLVTNASKSSQRRVPGQPIAGRKGAVFECYICLKTLSNIRDREQWKKHVFDDLEPYICTFEGCDETLSTFKSKREWVRHEMTVHRGLYNARLELARCPLCNIGFKTPNKGLYRHLGRHLRELSLASLPPADTRDVGLQEF